MTSQPTPLVRTVSSSTVFAESSNGVKIPPPGVRARMIGYDSKKSLFFNPSVYRYLDHKPVSETPDGIWFYIVPHESRENSYRIQSNMGNYFISSGGDDDLAVRPENKSDEKQIFTFSTGTGRIANWFRIMGHNSTYLISRKGSPSGPHVSNYTTRNHPEVHDDQWFQFETEDMRVVNLEYHIADGVMGAGKLVSLMDQEVINDSADEQNPVATKRVITTEQSSWEADVGVAVSMSMEASAGIPGVVEGKLSTTYSASANYKWGGTNIVTNELEISIPVKTSPGKRYRVSASLMSAVIDVPYTATLKSDVTQQTATVRGTYHGVTRYEITASYRMF